MDLKDPITPDAFSNLIKKAFTDSSANPIVIHGLRVQAMFEHVAAGLGRTTLIKQEDAGEISASDVRLRPPDYRIVLNDGRQLLVEVKNMHMHNFAERFSMRAQDT
ncbi:MAG: hypothetical protein JWL90_3974 [Chthoniobacteraceae bacterium]|nr:hypothetical protein [Chthoniobacteraceae bacterium]